MTTTGSTPGAGGSNQINNTDKVNAYKEARAERILKLDEFNKEKNRGNIQSWEDFRGDVDNNLKAAKKDLQGLGLSGEITDDENVRIQDKNALRETIGKDAYNNSFGVLNDGFSMAKKGGLTDVLKKKIQSFINGSNSEQVSRREGTGQVSTSSSENTAVTTSLTSPQSTSNQSTASPSAASTSSSSTTAPISTASTPASTPNQTESPEQTNSDSNKHPNIDDMSLAQIGNHAKYIHSNYMNKDKETVDTSKKEFEADYKFLQDAHELFFTDAFKSSITSDLGQYTKMLGEIESRFGLSSADNQEMTKAEQQEEARENARNILNELAGEKSVDVNNKKAELERLEKEITENSGGRTETEIAFKETALIEKAEKLFEDVKAYLKPYDEALKTFSDNGGSDADYDSFKIRIGEQGLGKYSGEVGGIIERARKRIVNREELKQSEINRKNRETKKDEKYTEIKSLLNLIKTNFDLAYKGDDVGLDDEDDFRDYVKNHITTFKQNIGNLINNNGTTNFFSSEEITFLETAKAAFDQTVTGSKTTTGARNRTRSVKREFEGYAAILEAMDNAYNDPMENNAFTTLYNNAEGAINNAFNKN